MSQEEDSSSSDEGLKHRALPVGQLPPDFDPHKPPTSAEEYLHQVMWEAKQYDDVVTAKIDKSRIKKQPAVVRPKVKDPAPPGYTPDAATQQQILEQFSAARQQVDRLKLASNKPRPPVKLPTDENPDHWCQFCFGNAFQRSILLKLQQAKSSKNKTEAAANAGSPEATASKVTVPEPVDGHDPLLSILLNVRQATLQNLMEWHVGWLEVAGFSEHQGRWLYSLLSCLEKPLTPELGDNVRKLVFLCARARARLDSSNNPHLPQLNTLITIVTRYFNQEDLADQC